MPKKKRGGQEENEVLNGLGFKYACVAITKHGGRCQRYVPDPVKGVFCKKPHKENVPVAPFPDVVFVNIRVNSKGWKVQIRDAGIYVANRTTEKEGQLDDKHAQHAKKLGRDPHHYRDEKSDSGTHVFGPNKLGIQFYSLKKLHQELTDAKFIRTDETHAVKRPGQSHMITLVLVYKKTGKRLPAAQTMVVTKLLNVPRWGYIHVHNNSPNGNGEIVHTVNASHKETDPPVGYLTLSDGFWGIEVA